MKKLKSIIALSLVLGMVSCGGETKKDDKKDASKDKKEVKEEVSHDEDTHVEEVLQLENGVKWPVNAEMMIPVREMEEAVAKFEKEAGTDYNALGAELKKGVTGVTSTCTMDGAAHDQLHIWLLPFISTVNQLKECESAEDGAKLFTEIQESFATFNTYFE